MEGIERKAGAGEGRERPRRRGCLRRLLVGSIFGAVVMVVVSGVGYVYISRYDRGLFREAASGLFGLAESLEKGEHDEKLARKLRELGEFVQERGPEAERASEEVERRLAEIKGMSETAYEEARRLVERYYPKDEKDQNEKEEEEEEEEEKEQAEDDAAP